MNKKKTIIMTICIILAFILIGAIGFGVGWFIPNIIPDNKDSAAMVADNDKDDQTTASDTSTVAVANEDKSTEMTTESTSEAATEATTEVTTERVKEMYTVDVVSGVDQGRDVDYVYIEGDDYKALADNVQADVDAIIADMPGADEVEGLSAYAEIYRNDSKVFSMMYDTGGFEFSEEYGYTYNADTGEKIHFKDLGIDEDELKDILYNNLRNYYLDGGFLYNAELDEGFTEEEIELASKTRAEKACEILYSDGENKKVDFTITSKSTGSEYEFYEAIVWYMTYEGIEIWWSTDCPENLYLQRRTRVSIKLDELNKVDSYYVN